MDFSLLQQMKSQTNALSDTRRSTSEEAYQKGIDLLAQAQASQFEDKDALKQASENLIRAIQYGRQNLPAYVAMAYLLILLDDKMTAVRYLNEAKRIDPDHEDVVNLIEFIKNPNDAMEHSDGDDFSPELLGVANEGDELYEEVQTLIQTELEALDLISWVPALTPQSFRILEEQYMHLEEVRAKLAEKLGELEFEMDTGALQQHARPLEEAQQKIAGLRKSSHAMLKTLQEMQQNIDAVQQDVSCFIASSPELEDKLEHYLDACDRFADVLDQTEEQGYAIAPFEAKYNQLVQTVEQLQDLLDA